MPKNRKRPRDVNQLAKYVVDLATAPTPPVSESKKPKGRAGGLVGGKVRAEKMSPDDRSEAAKVAALARWKKSG